MSTILIVPNAWGASASDGGIANPIQKTLSQTGEDERKWDLRICGLVDDLGWVLG
ncbi:MAG: hypothetical protein A4E58_01970 [Syntrophorhabdus sp. PtaB.Bin006]|nr:MAG: hypothetical protein A4E58_01970 [Syntrophorhabdus sp. PtaB.Bin006]